MYFFKLKGKQILDLRGNMILSHNPQIIRSRVGTAGPREAKNSLYVVDIPNLKFLRKLRTTFAAIWFIWGPNRSLDIALAEQEYDLEPAVVRKDNVRSIR